VLIVLVLASGFVFFYTAAFRKPLPEHSVEVTRVKAVGCEDWLLPEKVFLEKPSDSKGTLYQLVNLRARKVPVEILDYSGRDVRIKKGALA